MCVFVCKNERERELRKNVRRGIRKWAAMSCLSIMLLNMSFSTLE